TPPKTFAQMIGQRVTEDREITMKKSPAAEDHFGVRDEQQRREQGRKTSGREPFIRGLWNTGLDWFPEHSARLCHIRQRIQGQSVGAVTLPGNSCFWRGATGQRPVSYQPRATPWVHGGQTPIRG